MDTDERRANAVRTVLESNPASLRALAREAGVSLKLLILIRDGERRATPATVERLASALDRWTERMDEAVRALRESL